jgi:predicted molibdopterin-dependent oxidoreductase YjgC
MTTLTVIIDNQPCEVPAGISIAAALAQAGNGVTRGSVSGEPRAPFCGMGVCQECRVTVNGRRVLACQTECQPDMVIERSNHANV